MRLIVIYEFAPEDAPRAAAMLDELAAASREEPGNDGFEVVRGEDGVSFALVERWQHAAALDAHYTTPHFRRLGTEGVRRLALRRTAVKEPPGA